MSCAELFVWTVIGLFGVVAVYTLYGSARR